MQYNDLCHYLTNIKSVVRIVTVASIYIMYGPFRSLLKGVKSDLALKIRYTYLDFWKGRPIITV